MMNAMAAFCITLLFSVWVWSLKHELTEMQKRISPAVPVTPEPMVVGNRAGHSASSGLSTWKLD
ncbi:MAG TPA: hypothetical protein P5567_11640 [Kiritimatiellia bacterium]|nr:hypothetical protein [Kiritimatiellia bacterium]HSA17513.1 hypothetical protein [Kiritimatiellia bacterium]